MNEEFRVYTSPDMLGMELGGALKNVIALAAGVADGLGCGDNTKAALIPAGPPPITTTSIILSLLWPLFKTCISYHSLCINLFVSFRSTLTY